MADELTGDVDAAISFLKSWGAPWVLTAIDPDTREISTQTFGADQEKAASAFIRWWMGKRNLYFSVNRPNRLLTSKAEKKDIDACNALHSDVDPADGVGGPDEDARILKLFQDYNPPPSVIIHSGGGLQGFWLLTEQHIVKDVLEVEDRNRKIEKDLGGDHCHNIDRVMRLPGSINLPNKKKRDKGRVRAVARVISANWDLRYVFASFPKLAAASAPAPDSSAATPKETITKFPRSVVPEWCDRVIIHGPDPKGRYHYEGDRSKAVFAVACALVRCGWDDEEIVAVLIDPKNGISPHVLDQPKPPYYAGRQAQKARQSVGYDFARNDKGGIIINQPNLRLAFAKLGVEFTYDSFARRLLIEGPDGKSRRSLNDEDSTEVHLLLDELWHMRVKREYYEEVLENEARHRAFHPVIDYLDGLKWDGEARLDRWLVTYSGAEDNAYTRAVSTIVLLAAVRRVRQPGVKFDEMVILESAQGKNKSTSLAVLAVRDEWFSDSLPLDAEDKQVIEVLSGRWIVEAPELRRMRDVEHMKAFLSRQIDRARMSYGHFVTEAPRQCVIFGTTNSSTYLRDATGNRRFWPVKIDGIDIERLKADRDQLWAEAAAREAAGESIRLSPELYALAGLEQDRRLVEDPFLHLMESSLNGYSAGKIVAGDLWAVLNIPNGQRSNEHQLRLGETMKALGWERLKLRLKGKPIWHYAKGPPNERSTRIVLERNNVGGLDVYKWPDGTTHPHNAPPDYDEGEPM